MDKAFQKRQDLALAAIRLVVGVMFMAHGSQKLFALFGGGGISGTGKFFQAAACVSPGICLNPGPPLAALSGIGELGGGLLLLVGLFTPLAALLLLADMLVAMIFYSGPKVGYFNSPAGLETNFLIVAVTLTVLLLGAGRYGIDAAIRGGRNQPEGLEG